MEGALLVAAIWLMGPGFPLMKVLVFNCGSSSVKFQIVETAGEGSPLHRDRRLARGSVDRFGREASWSFELSGSAPEQKSILARNHEGGVEAIISRLRSSSRKEFGSYDAVGHRVVHGGDRFTDSVVIDDHVMSELEKLNELAPLHNPACLSGIRAARTLLDASVPSVAVFDTSFHRTIPDCAAFYALPYELSVRHKIRRYGFHGLAHRYAMLRYAEMAEKPTNDVNIITLHLGNGASACAIKNGQSVDTSMGFTPLEGLVMGTRSGDVDPAVMGHLAREEKLSVGEVEALLNHRSGLLGISGASSDMRELLARVASDERARLAVDMFCYRARKYVGAYLAALGMAEAIVFSGGIGENSAFVRAQICRQMKRWGLELDAVRNEATVATEAKISTSQSPLSAYVIPVNEESLIARDAVGVLKQRPDAGSHGE